MLRNSTSQSAINSHFASKLSGVFPGGIEDLPLGTPFTLKPAASGTLLNQAKVKSPEEVKAAAKKMESYFIYLMMKEMWATLPEEGFLDGGMATDIFQQMWLEKVSDNLASGSGIGLTPILEKQIADTTTPAPPPALAARIALAAETPAKPIPFVAADAIALAPLPAVSTPLEVPPVSTIVRPRATAFATPMVRPQSGNKYESMYAPIPVASAPTRPVFTPEVRPPAGTSSTPPSTAPIDIFVDHRVQPPAVAPKTTLQAKPLPLPGTPVKVLETRPEQPAVQSKPKAKPAPKPVHTPAPQPRRSGG